MADIRFNDSIIDDFERPDETPVQPPWFQNGVDPMEIQSGTLSGTEVPNQSNRAYFADESYSDDDMEIWAIAAGEAPLVEGWRFGMMTSGNLGYECLPHNGIGGFSWSLRRLNGGESFTSLGTIDGIPSLSQNDYVLMQLASSDVNVYHSQDNGDNWTFIIGAADSNYRTNMHVSLGTTGRNAGWHAVGGGIEDDMSQIYRRPNE